MKITQSDTATVKIFKQELLRRECCQCGARAMVRYTWLYEYPRQNERSSAYRRDDITHCFDHEEFGCGSEDGECDFYIRRDADASNLVMPATFKYGPGYEKMFYYWNKKDITDQFMKLIAAAEELKK